jgi:predicted dinucleotide-binding enzyme
MVGSSGFGALGAGIAVASTRAGREVHMSTPDDRDVTTELDRELGGTGDLDPDEQREAAEREATEDR